jgi:hypothetical protein
VLFVQGELWRHSIRLRLDGEAERIAFVHDGIVCVAWFGISVRTDKFSVRWMGSFQGAQTVVRGAGRTKAIGLLAGRLLDVAIETAINP